MYNLNDIIIESQDTDGSLKDYVIHSTYNYNNKTYAMVVPADSDLNALELNKVNFIELKFSGNSSDDVLVYDIEDDDEFNKIADYVESLF